MITPSREQQTIIEAMSSFDMVTVDAVAGSGKTTLVLHFAMQNPDIQILQVTYNRLLKDEVDEKRIAAEINNLAIKTYHGLANEFYKQCFNDEDMQTIMDDTSVRWKEPTPFTVLIVDESQDMTPLYYQFILRVISDLSINKLMLLGDKDQSVYQFKGADYRFLTLSDHLFPSIGDNRIRLPLSISYRVSYPIAEFVNRIMLGKYKIRVPRAKKTNHASAANVLYFRDRDSYKSVSKLIRHVKELLETGVLPDDIFILCPTVNCSDNNPIKLIERTIANMSYRIIGDEADNVQPKRIPIYMPQDGREVDKVAAKNKLCITTFHQAKGRERDYVYLFGFDENYFTFYARAEDRYVCPSTMYVAATRAKLGLFVFQTGGPIMPFIDGRDVDDHPDIITTIGDPIEGVLKDEPKHNVGVTYLTRHMSQDLIHQLNQYVPKVFKQLFPAGKIIPMAVSVNVNYHGKELVEEVSHLNGQLIPTLVEHMINGSTTVENYLSEHYLPKDFELRIKWANKDDIPFYQRMLRLINVYQGTTEGIHHQVYQINKFNWLRQHDIDCACDRLLAVLGSETSYEVFMKHTFGHPTGRVRVSGRLDVVDETSVWEIKCVRDLSVECFMQLLIYRWLTPSEIRLSHNWKLFNVRSGEIWEMIPDTDGLQLEMIQLILDGKYLNPPKKEDSIWLEEMQQF